MVCKVSIPSKPMVKGTYKMFNSNMNYLILAIVVGKEVKQNFGKTVLLWNLSHNKLKPIIYLQDDMWYLKMKVMKIIEWSVVGKCTNTQVLGSN